MHIGILVPVHTEATISFAREIATYSRTQGTEADLLPLKTDKMLRSRSRAVTLRDIPDISTYTRLVIGIPIWNFSTSPVILEWLSHIKNLEGTRVALFVTHILPWSWSGPSQALRTIREDLEICKATVCAQDVLWTLFPASARTRHNSVKKIYETLR